MTLQLSSNGSKLPFFNISISFWYSLMLLNSRNSFRASRIPTELIQTYTEKTVELKSPVFFAL
jgi:predicted kinase